MRPKLSTFRSSLLRMHRTILLIDAQLPYIDNKPKLSTFEKMIILLEDKRFLDHFGFDLRSIIREIVRWGCRRRHGGASTIDMQLFRTASDRYERTFRRKIRELIGVVILQRKFTKIQILRIYLRIAYFGTGIKGASDAAKAIFPALHQANPRLVELRSYFALLGYSNTDSLFEDKFHFDALSDDECAILASLLVYPKPRTPNANWLSKIRRRADYGLALYSRRDKRLDQILR